MKYQSKPEVIEAFQMTKEARSKSREWPLWLAAAWNKDAGTLGSMYSTGDGTLSIGRRDWRRVVSWGDWIIKGSDGELHLCSDSAFKAEYEELHEELHEKVQQPQLRQSVPKGTDETVWLNIYCAALNKPDTLAEHALLWADKGLKEFRDRFH